MMEVFNLAAKCKLLFTGTKFEIRLHILNKSTSALPIVYGSGNSSNFHDYRLKCHIKFLSTTI